MEDICERMISIVEGSGGVVSQRMVRHHLGQKIHDDEFWSEALDIQWDDLAAVREERRVSLKQVIECTYALSDAILEDYESLSRLVVRAMRSHCHPPTTEENCVDGTLSTVVKRAIVQR